MRCVGEKYDRREGEKENTSRRKGKKET